MLYILILVPFDGYIIGALFVGASVVVIAVVIAIIALKRKKSNPHIEDTIEQGNLSLGESK